MGLGRGLGFWVYGFQDLGFWFRDWGVRSFLELRSLACIDKMEKILNPEP